MDAERWKHQLHAAAATAAAAAAVEF